MSAGDGRSVLAAPLEMTSVDRVEGPLLFVSGVEGVGWDEQVEIRSTDGSIRHGVVVETDRDVAIVEVFEGTEALGVAGTTVAFTGAPMAIPVTERWLGRVVNGRGEPMDDGPGVRSGHQRVVAGSAINPARRDVPRDPVLTGVSAIDGLATLVRGQKLPVFSVGGLPHLELAIQIAAQSTVEGEAFRVVFAGMGLTNSDADLVRAGLDERLHRGDAVLLLNTADDPVLERVLTPRVALTIAEHLAFDVGHHVLVVLTDMTSYCDAVRQISSARGEIPSRRGYPGYLFSDLAGIYERCGRIAGRPGSITEVPVLTMPAGDISHPVPDLTGYITEGQIVLSPDLFSRGVTPPVDVLTSLSRLMRRGAGPGRTREDHLAIAAQLMALVAEARRVQELATLIGVDALSVTEQRYLEFAERFETDFVTQGPTEVRSLTDTLAAAWRVASAVPTRELTMVTPEHIQRWGRP
ncbi:MAG: V-type ATP synthase subunit B [Acidimicrobiales bacterium]|nr:V-type ATP synthase subunit B [Acidimicrobiales bacterium]